MKKRIGSLLLVLLLLTGSILTGCEKRPEPGKAHLYGEIHNTKEILDQEFAVWKQYYEEEGMRHLFVELSYYTAQYLNLWMQQEEDDILMELYKDWAGTYTQSMDVLDFYKKIKEECPETVFHGTDVGHQYGSTGYRYLKLLREEGKKESAEYELATEAVKQGRQFYELYKKNKYEEADEYREQAMTDNFLREFEELASDGTSIMGIYGAFHTNTNPEPGQGDTMAVRLTEVLGERIDFTDLSLQFTRTFMQAGSMLA